MWTARKLPEAPSKHQQVARGIMEAIRVGELVPGERLPTVRALAEGLGLAANTVAKAYRELERAGTIETRGRSGSFVSTPDARHALKQEAGDYAARARALGFSREETLRAAGEAWANLPLRR